MKGKTRHNSGNNKQITAKYPNKAKEIKKHFSTHTHTHTHTASHVKAQRTQSRICADTNKHISKYIKIKLQKIYNELKKH